VGLTAHIFGGNSNLHPIASMVHFPADRFQLQRFVEAQNPLYATVTDELRQGRKRTHWMWFVFPQVEGLGQSEMARRYAIRSRGEVIAYLDHPLLAARLVECTRLVLKHSGKSAHDIFGSPDDLKFRSSMTLFDEFSSIEAVYRYAPERFYDGAPDPGTVEILKNWRQSAS
jgi:uncharacterized protein (DUF1810 family)